MATQKTKLAVGLFLFVGISIGLLAFIWLGMSHYLEKGRLYCVYFNESVQGLEIDSPVKFRGVTIGRVVDIDVATDLRLIEVIVKIEKGSDMGDNKVAQLKNVGITGSMFIEIDIMDPDEPNMTPIPDFAFDYERIPSRLSDIEEIIEGIGDFIDQIKAIGLEEISGKINITLDKFNQAIDDANIKGLSKNLESSLEDIGNIVEKKRWDRILASVEEAIKSLESVMAKTDTSVGRVDNSLASIERLVVGKEKEVELAVENFRKAIDKVNRLLDNGNAIVAGADEPIYHLGQSLMEIAKSLEEATENINRISDMIADHPSQLLFGEPPQGKEIEE